MTKYLLLFIVSFWQINTYANDACVNAIQLTPTLNCVTTSGTFSGATLDGTAPSCANQASQDVWYKFTATEQTMSIFIERQTSSSQIFLAFEIYEDSCTGNRFKCIAPSQVYVNYFNTDFVIGRTYFIRVVNPTSTITTSGFNICLQALPKPANDTCATAAQLNPTANCVTTPGTFSGATLDGTAPSCANQTSQDVWYKFTATEQTMSIFIERQTSSSQIFLAFEIYEDSCTGNRFKCIAPSQVYVNYFNTDFVIGRTYFIRVVNPTSFITTEGFNICLQALPKPANDTCATAIQLNPTANCVTTPGTFSGALLDGTAPSCANQASQDVWYKFTATEQTMSIFIERQTSSSQIFLAFEIYEDNCTGNRFKCIAPSQVYVNYFNTDFVIGRTYYIRVVNPTSTITTSGFNICLQALPKPANDTCATAAQLNPTTNCVLTSGTFSGALLDGAAPSCANQTSQDVWYKFTATEQTMSIFIERPTTSSTIFLAFEIYEESCTGNRFKCIAPSQVFVNYFNTDFVIGRTYYIRVVNPTTTITTSGFNICLQALPKPANDSCATANELTPGANCVQTSGTFSGALLDGNIPYCYNATSQDVWYKFTATSQTMSVSVTSPTTNYQLYYALEIYEDSCSGNRLQCIAPGLNAVNYSGSNLVIGRTYYVRVVNPVATITSLGFNICLIGPPPVNCTPSVAINASATTICQGQSVTFTATPTNGGTTPSYQWKVNGNNIGNNSASYASAILANGDIVSCVMTSNAACAFPTAVTSNTISVTVNSVNVQTTTQGNTITAAATGATYQWINCANNQPINGATNASFTPVANGSYAVTVTQNGCTKTSNCVTISLLGIGEFEKEEWKIYPNPASHQLYIDAKDDSKIVITDMLGKIVQHCDLKSGTNTINVSTLNAGVYIIKSSSGTNTKFVKK